MTEPLHPACTALIKKLVRDHPEQDPANCEAWVKHLWGLINDPILDNKLWLSTKMGALRLWGDASGFIKQKDAANAHVESTPSFEIEGVVKPKKKPKPAKKAQEEGVSIEGAHDLPIPTPSVPSIPPSGAPQPV